MPPATRVDLDINDRVALAPGVHLCEGRLRDGLTSRDHAVNESAAQFLAQLDGTFTVKQIATATAARCDVDVEMAQTDLVDLVAALDRHALVVVSKSTRYRLAPVALLLSALAYMRLDWPQQPARRFAPTLPSLVRAALRSSRWGLVGALVTSLALFVVLLPLAQSGYRSVGALLLYAAIPTVLYAALVLQMLAHEAGHLLALRRLSSGTHYIAVRGVRLSVAYTGASVRQRRVIALAGPAAGLGCGLVMAAGALLLGLSTTEASLPCLLGIAHVYSLMPWAADGAMIFARSSDAPEEQPT